MKKLIGIVVGVLFLASTGFVSANDIAKGKPGYGMHHGMKMKEKMASCPIASKMGQNQVVATSDGGVVVVSGKSITKYDKNLKLIKTVDLKSECCGKGKKSNDKDCPMMNTKMKDKDCPMMSKGMVEKDDDEAETEMGHPLPAADMK